MSDFGDVLPGRLEREVIQCVIRVDSKPISIDEALKKKVWVKAMMEELEAIESNKT